MAAALLAVGTEGAHADSQTAARRFGRLRNELPSVAGQLTFSAGFEHSGRWRKATEDLLCCNRGPGVVGKRRQLDRAAGLEIVETDADRAIAPGDVDEAPDLGARR
jgi:hypothetical protein